MPYTWIVTKSQPHADSLAFQLRRQNFAARAIPCIEHHWNNWPQLQQLGSQGPSLLFVTSRAVAARVEVPAGTKVAAMDPTTSATLLTRGIAVHIHTTGGVRELADAVLSSAALSADTTIFYPTGEAAQRQPEHHAAVAQLQSKFRVQAHAVYRTLSPPDLGRDLADAAAQSPSPGFVFWSPSAVENFQQAQGFTLPAAPVVLVGGSTERAWGETAPPAWRRAFKHDADTPLEWSLRFIERGQTA